jgi:hypothetical protein
VADTFRIGPWEASNVGQPVAAEAVRTAVAYLDTLAEPRFLLVNIDDSLTIKDPDTQHLQGVGWHYDHAAARRKRARCQNAMCGIGITLVAGERSFTFDVQPYLTKKTVRRLNRSRRQQICPLPVSIASPGRCWSAPALIPQPCVYVRCDAWYASA